MTFFTENITVQGITVPLRCYIPDLGGIQKYSGNRPAVIIIPVGGYSKT